MWYKSKYKYYAINYLGVNNNLKDKINNFRENLDKKYSVLLYLKYFSYFFNLVCFIYYYYILFKNVELCKIGFGMVLLLLMILYIIANIMSLRVNIEYIQHFLNKINIDFERNKCDCIWIFILNIIGLIFFIYYISIIVYKFLSNDEYSCLKSITNESNPLENNEQVIKYSPVDSRENDRQSKHKKVDQKNKKEEEEKIKQIKENLT